nr:MAG TPA: hypothetical protein [Bacteriophage sp.]
MRGLRYMRYVLIGIILLTSLFIAMLIKVLL